MSSYIQKPTELFGKNPNGVSQRLVCDQWGSMSVAEVAHYWAHRGWGFEAGHRWSEADVVADNGTADIVFQVIDGAHIIWDIAAGGDCEIDIYDDPSWSIGSPENQITVFNKNEYSSNTSNNILHASPVITDPGTLSSPSKFLFGGTGGNAVGFTDGGFAREKIWKPGSPINTKLIRVTNRSGQDRAIAINFEWYQPQ